MADALDFEASNRKCGACGETGHNARTCKSKSVPFSTGGYWRDFDWDFTKPLKERKEIGQVKKGLPLVDGSHVAMISKIVDGEVLKEPNSGVRIPNITWNEEPIKMTWGELDEKCKKQDLVSIGESNYSSSYLRGALAYLPKNTVLTLYTGIHYPLKATFEYGGEEWIFFLAPRVDSMYAENFEAVVVNRGPQPKGAVAKTMMNHAMMEKAKIEEMIQELENKVRLGIISEDQLMMQLEKKFGADYEITISDEDMEKIAKSQGRTKAELETYWEQYENTTDVEVTDYYEEFKRKHTEMHEKFVDRLSREDYWYGDYKTNLFAKRKELKEMDIDFDMIDRYWEMNDERIPERVTCSACDGEGIIITKYYPATRYDPADADYENCEMCDGEGTYLDGNYMAETFEMEGMLVNWEGKRENEPVFCSNCKWDGLESDLAFSGGQYSHRICPECKRKDWEYKALEKNAETKVFNASMYKCPECSHLGYVEDFRDWDAETKKRKTGFRKCSKCGYSDHNSSNCNRLDEYETYRKHKDEMLKQCDRAIEEFTRDAKDYSEDGEYGMAKMRRSDATDMKKIKRMIENNHFGKAVHYARNLDSEPREYAPDALWMFYDAEEVKLSKTSCCCGATESNPCACMKAPKPMNCSATEPKCQCYKDLEKNAENEGSCFRCGCKNDLVYCELCEDYWCNDECREPSCWDKHYDYTCTRNAAETFEAEDPRSKDEAYDESGGRCEICETKHSLVDYNMNMNMGETPPHWIIICSDCEHKANYGAENDEDSWEKGVIRLAISSGCFSDEYAEWVERQIDGPSATLNNPRYKEIIHKRWGLGAEYDFRNQAITTVIADNEDDAYEGLAIGDLADEDWEIVEVRDAEEKGKRKIGETVAWNNSIIGMDGKWRNGKYDLYEIGNQIGYVVVHQDIENFEYQIQENGVLLGSKGTDIAQISFAGLNIYTGSDGSFPVVGLYEDIKDYYSRTQNKPHPRKGMSMLDDFEDFEKGRYLEGKWENEFTEWAKTVYDFKPQYYSDGTEIPLSYYVAKDLLQEDHKVLVGARVSISNPSIPKLEQRDSKSSVWLLEYPNLTDLTQGQYRQIRRGTNEVFVNTEKTVDKIFANLQKKYPQGMISQNDRGWRRTKSFSMIIPDFGDYKWTATEHKLVYDSLSDEEKKRKERLEREKQNKEYALKEKEKQDALKAKYGAEEGDDCPNCYCEHQNLSLDGTPSVDEEYVSVNVVCDDCGMKGYTTTYPYEWDNEAKLEDVGLPLAVNMYNPNYGELRCSRCSERFEKSAENYVLDVE